MEAKYGDGSNTGPRNWTSFKEFDVTSAPNYNANTITLTSAFFNEVNNGARVTLTFHFWSGTRVTYFVSKAGSSVTGSTTRSSRDLPNERSAAALGSPCGARST